MNIGIVGLTLNVVVRHDHGEACAWRSCDEARFYGVALIERRDCCWPRVKKSFRCCKLLRKEGQGK